MITGHLQIPRSMVPHPPPESAMPTLFVGGGNMASAMIGGLLRAGWPARQIRVAEPDDARREALAARHGVTVAPAAASLLGGARVLVIAVKPQQLRRALAGLLADAGTTVVSIAAGVRIASLRAALGDACDYVRCMPNTPALFGAGISGLYAPSGTPEAARQRAERVLSAAGQTCWVADEAALDAVTAVSGSGPAYFFQVVEWMQAAGEALGLPAATAALLAQQTLIGAARMVQDTGLPPAELRRQVTSPNGTTEAALRRLQSDGGAQIFAAALQAAADRSRALGDEFEQTPG